MKEVIAGVPQGSKGGPLLFHLFINELFLFICFSTLSNYADDNKMTENNWFYENFMILNPGKCHFTSINKDTHDEDVFYYDLPSKIVMKRKY